MMDDNMVRPNNEAQAVYDILLKTFAGNEEQLIGYYEDLIKEDLQTLNELRIKAQSEPNGAEKYASQIRKYEVSIQESSDAIKYFKSLNITQAPQTVTPEPQITEQAPVEENNQEKIIENELIELYSVQAQLLNQKRLMLNNYVSQLENINANTQAIILQDNLSSLSQITDEINSIKKKEQENKSNIEQKITEMRLCNPSYSFAQISPSSELFIDEEEARNMYSRIATKIKELEAASSNPELSQIIEEKSAEALHVAREDLRTICNPAIPFDQIISSVEESMIKPASEEEVKPAEVNNEPTYQEIAQEELANDYTETQTSEITSQPVDNNTQSTAEQTEQASNQDVINEYKELVNRINELTDEINNLNQQEDTLLSSENIDYDQAIETEKKCSELEQEIFNLKNRIAIIESTYYRETGNILNLDSELVNLNTKQIIYPKDIKTFTEERNKRVDECYKKIQVLKKQIEAEVNQLIRDSYEQQLSRQMTILEMEESLIERMAIREKQKDASFDIATFLKENRYEYRQKKIEDAVLNEVINKYSTGTTLSTEQENELNDIIGQPTSELDKILQSTSGSISKLQDIGNQFTSMANKLNNTSNSVEEVQSQMPQATSEQEQKAYDALSQQTHYMDSLSSAISSIGNYVNDTVQSYSDNLQPKAEENTEAQKSEPQQPETQTTNEQTSAPLKVTPVKVKKSDLSFRSNPKASRITCTIKNGVSVTTIRSLDNQIKLMVYKNLSNKLSDLKNKMDTTERRDLPGLSNSEPYDKMEQSMEEIASPSNIVENANSDLLNAMRSIGM